MWWLQNKYDGIYSLWYKQCQYIMSLLNVLHPIKAILDLGLKIHKKNKSAYIMLKKVYKVARCVQFKMTY